MQIWFFLLFDSGHDHGAKSNSKKEERKTGRLSLKPRRLEKNRTARQAIQFRKSKSCQAQSASQFSLPLLPEAENRQPAAKYQDVFWSPGSSAKKGMWKSHLYDLLKQSPELWLWIMASSEGVHNLQKQKILLALFFWKIVHTQLTNVLMKFLSPCEELSQILNQFIWECLLSIKHHSC